MQELIRENRYAFTLALISLIIAALVPWI